MEYYFPCLHDNSDVLLFNPLQNFNDFNIHVLQYDHGDHINIYIIPHKWILHPTPYSVH